MQEYRRQHEFDSQIVACGSGLAEFWQKSHKGYFSVDQVELLS